MPSIVPAAPSSAIYFVLCDYGPEIGRAYRETDPDRADRETILKLLMSGEFTGPVQVMEVDLVAGRARDVSEEFAIEILDRTFLDDLPSDVSMFVSLRSALSA